MLLVTNSYWFRESYLSKLCFIIICQERKQKVLILNSSEKFIIFLANIRHVRFNMENSKHRYCRCLLIFFGLVKMTFGLVDVKLTFFAPCFDNTAIYFKTFWQPLWLSEQQGNTPLFCLKGWSYLVLSYFQTDSWSKGLKEIYFPFTLPSSLPCPQVKSVISETTLGW